MYYYIRFFIFLSIPFLSLPAQGSLSTPSLISGKLTLHALDIALPVCHRKECFIFSQALCDHYQNGEYGSGAAQFVLSVLPDECHKSDTSEGPRLLM